MLRSLVASIDPRPVGLTRIIVGTAALLRAVVAWRVLSRLSESEVLRLPYATWLPDPSPGLVIAVVATWVVAALLFTIGWKVVVAGPLLLGVIVLTLSLDQQAYSNHLYLMAWLILLLTLASAGSGINVSRHDRSVTRWPVLLVMLQGSLVYFFSAITKLNESFLSGSVLAGTLGAGLLRFPDSIRTPEVTSVVAAAAVFVELFIAVFLWSRKFRPAAFLLGLGLHLSITLLMTDTLELLVFSLEMLAIYPLFLSRGKLAVVFDDECAFCSKWIGRMKRLDLLRVLDPVAGREGPNPVTSRSGAHGLQVVHHGKSKGFKAMTLALEHLVPTLWIAPVLRLPGLSHLGERWYRAQDQKASRAVVVPASLEVDPVTAHENPPGART